MGRNGDHLTINLPSYQYRDSHVIKIRRSHDLLIFIMGIPTPDNTILFILQQGPDFHKVSTRHLAYTSFIPGLLSYFEFRAKHHVQYSNTHVYVLNEASMLTIDSFLHFMPSPLITLCLPLPAWDLNVINPFQKFLTIPLIISKLRSIVLNVCYHRRLCTRYKTGIEWTHLFA